MQSRRPKTAGYTLIEALMAGAAVTMIAIPSMSLFSRATIGTGRMKSDLAVNEFIYSLLEERAATRDFSEGAGTYGDRFEYSVTTTPYAPSFDSRYDAAIALVRMTVSAHDINASFPEISKSQVIARKR